MTVFVCVWWCMALFFEVLPQFACAVLSHLYTPGDRLWAFGLIPSALINLTAEDNPEYLIFGSNWRSVVWILNVVATGYHPEENAALSGQHVQIFHKWSSLKSRFSMKLVNLKRHLLANDSQLCSFGFSYSFIFLVSYWQQPQMRIITYQSAGISCTLHLAPYLVPNGLSTCRASDQSYSTSGLSCIHLCLFLQHQQRTVVLWGMSNKNWNLHLRNTVGTQVIFYL